ncbi:TraB/GumN family protein [Methanohalobium sp.]|uniref:TraB/GumN family protein n=1 Tax=Methanohalobium sp. TaxID=2837493 RepID=UPI0039797F59
MDADMNSDNKVDDSQSDSTVYKYHTTSQSSRTINEQTVNETETDDVNNNTISASTDSSSEPTQIKIIGTAHVSQKSVDEVIDAIKQENPDIVAVELCRSRYEGLKGEDKSNEEISIKQLLGEGKIYFFLMQWLLGYMQKKIGKEMGVKPGSEMISAIDAAEEIGADIALVDRDIQITLRRFWGKMGFFEKIKMVGSLIGAVIGVGGKQIENVDMDDITNQDVVTMLVEELRKIAPTAAEVLIDERDAYIAGNLVKVATNAGSGKKIIAVVGAGHKSGIQKYLSQPDTIPPLNELTTFPKKKRLSVTKAFGFGIVGIAIATFLLIILSGTPLNLLLMAFGGWFIINGVLSAGGTVLARGHPYSVLTAFSTAWLTSLNPMMAAGWFAGLMEAKQRKPRTEDFKTITQMETKEQMFNNRLFRVVLVAALANVGSMIGTFLGVYVMLQITGIDPRDVIDAGLRNIGF